MEEAVKGKVKRRHLSAAECLELGQSTDGTSALTQPQNTNQKPNRGLYPRTPTKRRKCASASGSPAGKQKDIHDFFSVTKVISSSPHKSSQPCSSTHTNGLNGEPCPKEEPQVGNELDEEEDDDDVSLLAAAVAPGPVMEEEEVDDVAGLAAMMLPEPETKQQQLQGTVDYLEGMTAEMFGDDDEFDQLDRDDEAEEVDPLPDAHFGLLGSGRDLLQPQGCLDDLPEEVLRQVLCLLPAQDLYRSGSLVCHRWRNIIQDNKFVPFKKQYFRYMMKEKDTVQEILSLLETSGITHTDMKQPPPQYCIRHLVVLMAQHNVGERVRPEDVLQCVKKHRLFPHAEASIRLRIPDIQKRFNLGIEGPNPFAAMAVVLILSESVRDVQALVSLLTGCLSHGAISEFLCRMAMMLLALTRSKIQISNRLHYNIYYVLHLMENGPFSVGSGQSGQPQIQLTCEQQRILSHDIQEDHVVKIIAFAGTGKTTTLVKYAEQRPHLRLLYVAFNKSVATEAQRRFPGNVDCKTVHSLAFKDVGRRYQSRQKLTCSLNPFTINSVLPKGRGGYVKAKVVAMTLNAFMGSADPVIDLQHVPTATCNSLGEQTLVDPHERPLFVRDARTIWGKMKDLSETTKKTGYYMTHDGYLKLWQLQIPKPQLSDQYDAIFIDEAQDCTPAIMDVLLSQRCGKILVGDPHQQIYTFKGAVNALQIVDHTHIYYLTQSFRFGAEIAYVGATILKVCKGVQKILVGGKQKGGVCGESAVKVAAAIKTGVGHRQGTTAILSRSNISVFTEAVRLTDVNPLCRIHFVGGVKSIGLNRILDVWHLKQGAGQQVQRPGGQPNFIRDALIRSFAKKDTNGFWALKKYVEQTEDKELETKLNIVEKYTGRIPELVMRLERCHEEDYHSADFVVGTVHKAKGLEFDTVVVYDDFVKLPCSRHNLRFNRSFSFNRVPDDEWNLLYVAATRAKTSLIITKTILRILTVAGEYFLKSQMPGALVKEGESLPCRVNDCPNCVTPGSAFVMCKQKIRCTDGVTPEGPLCERCVWTRIGPTAFLMTDDVLSMGEIPRGFRAVIPNGMLLALF